LIKKEGKTLAAYDPSKSRANANFANQTERSLAYSMYNHNKLISGGAATKAVDLMLKGTLSGRTAANWFNKFRTDDFNINMFITQLGTSKKSPNEPSMHSLFTRRILAPILTQRLNESIVCLARTLFHEIWST
jgi:hypothetical protein